MKMNNRLNCISEYHFKKIDDMKEKILAEGKDVLDLGIGDPDLQVDERILKALMDGLKFKNFNRYPPYEGMKELKKAVIKYYDETYEVKLSMDEVVILIGSKEGLSNLLPAVCDFNDIAIVPQLGYPVYETCSRLWGVEPYKIPLTEKDGYLPRLSRIPENIRSKAKLFFINYPNNPTGARANADFYREVTKYCAESNMVLCNDSAYNEIIPENEKPLSSLQFDEKKNGVEFGTFSKIYNMTGFRVGYAVGNEKIIKSLLKVKSNVDSGQFIPIQLAAVEAMKLDRAYVNSIRRTYDERRSEALRILKEKNIHAFNGGGTFYLWCKVPSNYTTDEFCEELLGNHGMIVTPGYCFGSSGFGYFRIALTKKTDEIARVLSKMKKYE